MARITQSIEINKPAGDVEKCYTNWSTYPEFIPFLRKVEEKNGKQLDCELTIAGMKFDYTAEVEKVDDQTWSWNTTKGTITHSGTAEITPVDQKRSRLTMVVDYEMPGPKVAGKITNWLGLADSGLRSALENFRAYAENK